MRTIIDIPDRQNQQLAALCSERGVSRSEAIRQSIDYYLKAHLPSSEDVFGLWKDRGEDGLVYQQHLRDEWDA